MGTCTFLNMLMPLTASWTASVWGVVTIMEPRRLVEVLNVYFGEDEWRDVSVKYHQE